MISILHILQEEENKFSNEFNIIKIELKENTKFTDSQVKQMERLFNQLNESDKGFLPNWYFEKIHKSTFEKEINSIKKSNNNIIYLLQNKENNIIGFSRIVKKIMVKDTTYVATLIIDKKYRHQGLGRYFLKYILKDCKNLNSNKLFALNCLVSNEPAKKLYSSLGFNPMSQFMVKHV